MNDPISPQSFVQVGPFRIERRLGGGGMGEVFRAYDTERDRLVALKQIRTTMAGRAMAKKRFLREAKAAARVDHPALVRVHGVFEAKASLWIVMELVEGEPLARLLEAGPLASDVAVALAIEMASGLEAAHSAGIVHRDLKTENVIVTSLEAVPPGVKILDFGLAKPFGGGFDAAISRPGGLYGTPHAMSPEQASGAEVGPRSDLFSFGSLLYEMLTGEAPFLGPGPLETLARVCVHRPAPLAEQVPGISHELSELVERLLAKDAADRPESAGEVVEALRAISS